MTDKLEFKKIREFGEVVNDTFLFIKQNFKPLIKVFAYLCGFFVLAGMFAAIMHQLSIKDMKVTDAGNIYAVTQWEQIFTLNFLLIIIFGVANFAAVNVSILGFISLYVEKGNVVPTVEEVWAYFKYYYFRVFGSSFIVALFLSVSFVACLIPGVYIFPAMSLFFPVMILENGSFGYSFNRSFKLLNNQWWVTAGTIFIIWIIAYSCMMFASLPAIILVFFNAFTQGSEGLASDFIIVFSNIVQYLCQVFMIIPVIGISLCYFNLTERLENTGLMERINHFGTSEPDFNSSKEEY